MPARTLDYLIKSVKEELFIFGNQVVFRSGDSADPGNTSDPHSVSITRCLNKAQGEYAKAADYLVDELTVTLTNNTRTYVMPAAGATISAVYYRNYQLLRSTIVDIGRRDPAWRMVPSAVPSMYYMMGSNKIGVFPPPSAASVTADANLTVVCSQMPVDLNVLTDIPASLPYEFHDALAYGAALIIANMDAGNEKATKRAGYLKERWEEAKSELVALMGARALSDLAEPINLRAPETTAHNLKAGS